MSLTIDRDGARTRADDPARRRRRPGPVLVATFDGAPFHPDTARLAVEAAAETGAALLVVDVVEVRPGRRGARRALDPVPAHAAAGLAVPVALADERGVRSDTLRVAGLSPVAALLDVVREHAAALVVLAPDPARLRRFRRPSRRRFGEFRRALARHAPCLLWSVDEVVVRVATPAAAAWSQAIPATYGPAGVALARPRR